MLGDLKGWLSRVKEGGADPVLMRVQTIAELHVREEQGVRE